MRSLVAAEKRQQVELTLHLAVQSYFPGAQNHPKSLLPA